ncbi:hypothetical protein FKM82_028113, partial [Ascaphus truei]
MCVYRISMVDDLEDSSSEEKTLHNQPSIGTLARDLFLCDKESDYKKCLGDVSRAQEKGNGMEGSPGITADQGAGKEDGQSQAGHGTDDDDDGSSLGWDNLEDLNQL